MCDDVLFDPEDLKCPVCRGPLRSGEYVFGASLWEYCDGCVEDMRSEVAVVGRKVEEVVEHFERLVTRLREKVE